MAYDYHEDRKHDDKHDKDVDIEIKKEFKEDVEVKKEFKEDVEVKKEFKEDVEVKKEFKEDVEVKKEFKAEIEVKKEDVEVKKDIKEDVEVKKDIEVDKDVDVDVWKTHVDVKSDSIIQDTDNDVNDIDSQELIDVGPEAILKLDDFAVRNLAIGKSFNGSGNDSQYSVTQSNNLKDNDTLIAPTVAYFGSGGSDGVDGPEASDFSFPGHGGDEPFQKVEAEGGKAEAGDGTGDDSEANENGTDGSVSGEAIASADGIATVQAFTQDILMGGNQQANFATFDVTGGDSLQANDIDGTPPAGTEAATVNGDGPNGEDDGGEDGGLAIRNTDNDVNDLDAQELIDVSYKSALTLDDFRLDTVAIGESFNGPGNDMQFDVVQVNDMLDNDFLFKPEVKYVGSGGATFQDVKVEGGEAMSGDGTGGTSTANNNGLDGSVSGSTVASADAIADVSAFTQNIVMGANLQVNNLDATVVGGDSTIADNVDFTG